MLWLDRIWISSFTLLCCVAGHFFQLLSTTRRTRVGSRATCVPGGHRSLRTWSEAGGHLAKLLNNCHLFVVHTDTSLTKNTHLRGIFLSGSRGAHLFHVRLSSVQDVVDRQMTDHLSGSSSRRGLCVFVSGPPRRARMGMVRLCGLFRLHAHGSNGRWRASRYCFASLVRGIPCPWSLLPTVREG